MRNIFFYTLTLFSTLGFAEMKIPPQVVVFDFGGVMTGKHDREAVVQFLRDSFQLSATEFETVNQKKREALKTGKTDEEFWLQYAQERGIALSENWPQELKSVMKEALNINPVMYTLVDELKANNTSVALLSNIDERLAALLKEYGCYEPFDPCLLSCEIQLQKPDPKAYEHLLEKLGISAPQVVFIDDLEKNIEVALELGIDAILFQSAEQIREELNTRGLL